MTDFAIQTRQLTKFFGAKCVVRDLNLNVPRGAVYGFLGRNGSGKSTTLRMVLGLLTPTWGSSTVLGHDSQQLPTNVRPNIGYLAETHPVWGWMRVKDVEAYQSRFYAKWNRELFHSVLKFFRVDSATRACQLSRGERAGLCLAMVLAPEPDLLILDDPAIGLDPVARRSLLETMVHATRKAGRTIVFASHLLADIERLADHIAVLDYSVLRAECSLDTFRSCIQRFIVKFPGRPPQLPQIRGLIQSVERDHELRLTLVNLTQETRCLLENLGAERIDEAAISLEDALVAYLGDGSHDTCLPDTPETAQVTGGIA